MKKNKGFTLIEIMIVITIIALLAGIVLAALSSARNKGNDAAVQSNLRNAVEQGDIFWNSNTATPNTYTNFCAQSGSYGANTAYNQVLAAAKAVGLSSYATNDTGTGIIAVCNDSIGSWAAEVPLTGSTTSAIKVWCVDSTGKSKQETVTIGAGTACN